MRASLKVLAFTVAAGLATAPAAAQQPSRAITPEWFAGVWSDSADCSAPVQFFPDGRYRTADGSEARWSIEHGNVIVLSGPTARETLMMERVGDRQLRTIPGGVVSYRCDESAMTAALAAAGRAVTADWLVGTWSDLRDCSEPFIVAADGGFRAPNGIWGRWSLSGDMLTLTFGENSQSVRLLRVGADELKLAATGVSSYRCS